MQGWPEFPVLGGQGCHGRGALPLLYSILLSPHPLPGDIAVRPTDLKPETELFSWPTDLSLLRTAYCGKPPHEGVCTSLCAVEHSPGLRCSIVPTPPFWCRSPFSETHGLSGSTTLHVSSWLASLNLLVPLPSS